MSGARVARATDVRLAGPALALWAVAAILVGLPAPVPVAWMGVVACAAVAVCALVVAVVVGGGTRGRRRGAGVLLVAAAAAGLAAAGCVSIAAHGVERRPAVLEAAAHRHRSVVLDVRVDTPAVAGRIRGTAETVTSADGTERIRSPILVFAPVGARPDVGALLRVAGGVRIASPGDAVAYLVFARDDPVVVGRPAPLAEALAVIRKRFSAAARRLPDPGGGLLPGLAIGDTSAVGEQTATDMRTASLTHLTAVSGANCAVVVALVLVLLSALGAPRMLRLVGSGVALALFVGLVLPQPSVIRAAAMAVVVLIAAALGRPVRGAPVLAAATIALILVDPWLARDPGFVLSVLATGGLLLLAPVLARRLGAILPRPIALAVAVPTAAQAACQPVLLLLNPTVPLWGIPANLLAEPAAPIATVLGLIACLILPVAPPLGHAITALAWVPSAWIAAVAHTASTLPSASLPWLPGVAGAIAMAGLVALLCVVLATRHAGVRAVSGALVVLIAVGWSGTLAGVAIASSAGRPAEWEFAECDIGQGDSTVIRSAGRIAVVDTGPKPDRMRHCLTQLGITHIDLLVLTHYDLDHVGGTPAVLGMVDRAFIGPSSGPDDDRIADELRRSGAAVEQGLVGMSGTLGTLDWRILWPPPTGVEPGNPASVTLSVAPAPGCRSGCLTGLLLGDLGAESQTRLMGSTSLPRYDVVKVAHHGSADQAPALYARIRAPIGLLGVGTDNDYGHPTAFCLEALVAAGTRPFRTDLLGLVLVAGDGRSPPVVWTEKSASPARIYTPEHGRAPVPAATSAGLTAAGSAVSSVPPRLAAEVLDARSSRSALGAAPPRIDPAAGVGSGAPCTGRAHLGQRERARRPGCARLARPPPHRGSEPRGP